jgi:phosphoribosylanthranilate isomerase
MLIKVCGLKETANVKELLKKGTPDLLGMIFYEKSKRYIGDESFEIGETSSHISKVGVFVNASIEQIIQMQQAFGLEWVQLHGDEDLEYISVLRTQTNMKIIKVFRVEDKIDLEAVKPFGPFVDYFLFDTQTAAYGGSGNRFDWQALEQYNLETPFIVSGGIDLEHVSEITALFKKIPQMAGVDINSKFETAPGIKDPEKVARFINIIRENKIDQL